MTEGGWVDNWEGGCQDKGRRGVERMEVSETTEMLKSEPDLKLILYKVFGDISFNNVSESFV